MGMSNSNLSLFALLISTSLLGVACAVDASDPTSETTQSLRRAPAVVGGQPVHGEVVVDHPPTTHPSDSPTLLDEQSTIAPESDPRPSGRTHVVLVEDRRFVPATLTIDLGDTVEFVWATPGRHDVTSGFECLGDGKFESGVHGSGSSWRLTYLHAGIFPYFSGPECDVMQGLLVVKNP